MSALDRFRPAVARWFERTLGQPTPVQERGWQALEGGRSALLLAPTGSGKTLAAFLAALDRLMFASEAAPGVRVVYVSPLKALGSDVERNLRLPLAGIAAAAAELGVAVRTPSVLVRSGDTPANDRARFRKQPSEILITTPESLYLLLTSQAARHFSELETVIVDEIHTLVGTKRGAHLALSLERLERLRTSTRALQRIGLSATVRPLDAAAGFLGGLRARDGELEPRPVSVVDAGAAPHVALKIEVPIEDMAVASDNPERSIWPSLHGPLIELIRSHRSTLLFVNSRRLAERLSSALNETAGEALTFAHHGSVAKERRTEIEEALKAGALRGLVATSSLELGIDMGAIDLVIQIGTPPSVASGLQRIGRAGHAVGEISEGVMIPKFRGELLGMATVAERMRQGEVEPTSVPMNPLDVLAQQIVAIVSDAAIGEDELFDLLRCALPFKDLPRASFESVLDLLSGRYPSADFSELKPRLIWDRQAHRISARQGARHIAIVNGGTIPDRGLFGVFLAGTAEGRSVRVGELDEEMVYESRAGEVFLLGASSWRIDEITVDRVLVTPAPGEPGRMPFWRGDQRGRSLELGRAIGKLGRELTEGSEAESSARLEAIGLDERAAKNLRAYLNEQREATGSLPSDLEVVVEQFVDEIGDFRVCVLSSFGARVHAPWALACMELQRRRLGIESDAVWADDGIAFRFPEATPLDDLGLVLPEAQDLDELLLDGLAKSSLFAARFRENAARALLLPRRRPGQRMPLWAQRRRSADLLRAASQHVDFPILLETYRECLSDVFDVPGLRGLLEAIAAREIRVTRTDRRSPSPYASALLFSYVGNFMYEGDAPLAERRAQALTIDPARLRALLGEAELRKLLDPEAIASVVREARGAARLAHADAVHDLLLALGDHSFAELCERAEDPAKLEAMLAELVRAQRIVPIELAGEPRYVAIEEAARYRDAFGARLPEHVPPVFLSESPAALADLTARYARTHGPFRPDALAERYALPLARASDTLAQLAQSGRLVAGEFLADGHGTEYVDAGLLARIRQRSLMKLRREVEPVAPRVLARFGLDWQGLDRRRRGAPALGSALEQLEGAPLVASALERDVLPARIDRYQASELDLVTSSGEFVWRGLESIGASNGRIAFYRGDHYALLAPAATPVEGELAGKLREQLRRSGASFFAELAARTRAFPRELLDTLWAMVWAGEVTNDTLAPLRSRLNDERQRGRPGRVAARRAGLPGSEGRWSLLERWLPDTPPSDTERAAQRVQVLLERYGVLTREAITADALGSFSELYPVLKALEDTGRIRRGYFAATLGAAQFAKPSADDRLRKARDAIPGSALVLAATDPANPFGSVLPWPEGAKKPQRAAGALVVLWDGLLLGFLARGEKSLETFVASLEREREEAEAALAQALSGLVDGVFRRAMVLTEIDAAPARQSSLGPALERAGFTPVGDGYVLRRSLATQRR